MPRRKPALARRRLRSFRRKSAGWRRARKAGRRVRNRSARNCITSRRPARCRMPRAGPMPMPPPPLIARGARTPPAMPTAAAKRSRRRGGSTGSISRLIRLFRVDRIDRAGPRPAKFFQQLLRRRGAARELVLQYVEVARLILAADVEMPAPNETGAGKRKNLVRDRQRRAAAQRGGEALFRHRVAQCLALAG